MKITTKMLQELEQSIAPGAEAEIRIYAGGCDIRVRWNGGLRQANQNLSAEQLATTSGFDEEKVVRAWKRLITKFQRLKDM